jgi:thiosulfate dehydrogenase (quinone) large subunit
MVLRREQQILGILRISLGFIFFWAFIDKLFGLGFATTQDKAWLLGNSPTAGFLTKSTYGPLASLFQGFAGSSVVDWLFMMGLVLIGLSLILGIGVKIAGWSGALLMVFMYMAMIPPKNNPLVDDHIIYAALLIFFTQVKIGQWIGLGKQWVQIKFVKQHSFLE